jgi:hypothetical protein
LVVFVVLVVPLEVVVTPELVVVPVDPVVVVLVVPDGLVVLVDPEVVRLVSFVVLVVLVELIVVDVEVTLLMYILSLFPAPQYVSLSPGHKKLQSESLTFLPGVAALLPFRLRSLPHQHSTPYSIPTYA